MDSPRNVRNLPGLRTFALRDLRRYHISLATTNKSYHKGLGQPNIYQRLFSYGEREKAQHLALSSPFLLSLSYLIVKQAM